MLKRICNQIDKVGGNFIAQDFSDNIWLLRRGVYLAVFFYFLLLIPVAPYFFGPTSLVFGYNSVPDWIEPFTRVLFTRMLGGYYWWFFVGLFLSIIVGMYKPVVRWLAPVVYVLAVNLFNKAEFIANGSVPAMGILLFFLIFMSERKNIVNSKTDYINALITNMVFVLARFQVCVIYLTAGIYKLTGESWLAGEGFYYSLNFQFLSSENLGEFLLRYDVLLYAGNYFSLFYQLLFPVLIWIKPIKKWLMLAGVMLHLGIIVVNGLVDFGLIMLVSYSLFLNPSWIQKIRKPISVMI